MQKQRTQLTKSKRKHLLGTIIALVLSYIAMATIILVIYKDQLNTTNVLVMLGAMLLLLSSVGTYLYFADKDKFFNARMMSSMCTMMVLSLALLLLFNNSFDLVVLAPLTLCALTTALIVSTQSGFISNFCVILIYFVQSIVFDGASVNLATSFYVLFAGMMTTTFAMFVMGRQYKRLVYINIGLVLGGLSAVIKVISYFMFTTDFVVQKLVIDVAFAFGSGLATVILMLFILPIIERIFNVVSPFRFSEIATSNNAIMREMFEKAPGTYNHSLTVANYVEACAVAIGESSFLARTVAYYHDIGKMKSPKYFAENIGSDESNPHDNLTPKNSVSIIKGHVQYGLQLAKENQLPIEVQRAIVEHHGTMPMKFFYLKAKKYTDGDLPYDDYLYDGPKPTNKVNAILMICDASEAALRSVGDSKSSEEIVDAIVAERMKFNQFSNCDITMKEIETIKSTIITTHLGIKHNRIQYPNVKLEDN